MTELTPDAKKVLEKGSKPIAASPKADLTPDAIKVLEGKKTEPVEEVEEKFEITTPEYLEFGVCKGCGEYRELIFRGYCEDCMEKLVPTEEEIRLFEEDLSEYLSGEQERIITLKEALMEYRESPEGIKHLRHQLLWLKIHLDLVPIFRGEIKRAKLYKYLDKLEEIEKSQRILKSDIEQMLPEYKR